ncbi:MAG: MarR family transcriptional regulator [Pontixanthobacter sp.]
MQTDFTYEPAAPSEDARAAKIAVSIFADRDIVRNTIGDDAELAGMRLRQSGDLELLCDRNAVAAGEIVIVDCPAVSAAILAALCRLDERATKHGAQLIVSTSIDGMESAFACLDQSRPLLLVDPTRGERVIALGQVLTMMSGMKVRDLSESDRVSMLRLSEQVAEIAQRLERMDERGSSDGGGAFRFNSPGLAYAGEDGDHLVRSGKPAMPDPRLVRRIIRQRQMRAKFFDSDLFADPAWDILLDLTAARAEHLRVSVTSLCIAANVPPTTALRWITQMIDVGLLQRVEDDSDRRRAFIALTDRAAECMARYFDEMRKGALEMV